MVFIRFYAKSFYHKDPAAFLELPSQQSVDTCVDHLP